MTADRITVGPAAERDFSKWASETIAKQASEIAALRRRVAPFVALLGAIDHCAMAEDIVDVWVGGNWIGKTTVAQWRALSPLSPGRR